ncbi:MAG: hypothetical protein JWM33_3583 [Caulobacteraceae bacterium]|nr:hypothetical protein [Caulobacteraceae bacterium]
MARGLDSIEKLASRAHLDVWEDDRGRPLYNLHARDGSKDGNMRLVAVAGEF